MQTCGRSESSSNRKHDHPDLEDGSIPSIIEHSHLIPSQLSQAAIASLHLTHVRLSALYKQIRKRSFKIYQFYYFRNKLTTCKNLQVFPSTSLNLYPVRSHHALFMCTILPRLSVSTNASLELTINRRRLDRRSFSPFRRKF